MTAARSPVSAAARHRLLEPARGRLVDTSFGLGWALTRHAPEAVSARLLEGLADRAWRRGGGGVEQLRANLRRAARGSSEERLDELTHAALRSYFRYWHEAFRLPAWSASRVVDSVVTHGEAGLRAAYADGRGAIIALPHMANWDLAGAWACLTGMPVTTVAERLRPAELYDRFVAYRETLGMEVLPLTGGGATMRGLRDALRRGRLVCLVAERDLLGTGAAVTLLGEAARMPTGPVALAAATGAPLFALTLSYHGPLLQLDFSERIDVARRADETRRGANARATQQVADWFSAGITAYPMDWHMLQRVFVRDLGSGGVQT